MAIIDLQRRIAEVGRIRIGQQIPTKGGSMRPAKLDTFRLTSPDLQRIRHAARLYGGEVHPWKAPAGSQWEVITTTDQLPVLVPPADMAFSQYYELWSRGGCQRRCDGQQESISDGPCLCDPEAGRQCEITTRLNVLLRDIPGLGVWRLDTSGYYAAVELGGAVDILERAATHGRIIPATLRLEQRVVTRVDQGTRRFAVPVLDLAITVGELFQATGNAPALDALAQLDHQAPQDQPVIDDQPPPPDEPPRARQRPSGTRKRRDTEPDATPTPLAQQRTVADQLQRLNAVQEAGFTQPPLTPPPQLPTPSIAQQVAAANVPVEPTRRGATPISITGIPPRTAVQTATSQPQPATIPTPTRPAVASPAVAGFAKPPGPKGNARRVALEAAAAAAPPPPDTDPRAPGPNQTALGLDLDRAADDMPATAEQLDALRTMLTAAGFIDLDTQLGFLSAATNRTILDIDNDITNQQANDVMDILELDKRQQDNT